VGGFWSILGGIFNEVVFVTWVPIMMSGIALNIRQDGYQNNPEEHPWLGAISPMRRSTNWLNRRWCGRILFLVSNIFAYGIWAIVSIIIVGRWVSIAVSAITNSILRSSREPWFIPVAALAAWLLYILRARALCVYAVSEILAGVAAISASVYGNSASDFARVIAVLGGTYIIVRGLDNFDKGLPQLKQWLPTRLADGLQRRWDRYIAADTASHHRESAWPTWSAILSAP
jgi:hypothetical protein